MRKNKKFTAVKVLIITILALVIAIPAFGYSTTTRVFVEYKGNNMEQVQQALSAVGAEFHFHFQRLNSFVVTVGADEIDGLRANPNVVDVQEDVERTLITPVALYNDIEDENNPGQIIPWGIQAVRLPGSAPKKLWEWSIFWAIFL